MSSVPPPESHANSPLPKVDNPDDYDIGIQDSYVSWALKNQKVLPPITWENWFSEVNWLNATIVGFPTLVAIYALFNVKLRWETALFSGFYYFITALGKHLYDAPSPTLISTVSRRNHGGIP
jgi:stearoyl-CoA desaturase (delta-9 desaturase)